MKNIDAERWKMIERILDEALDKIPEEREEFVRLACGDDEALRKEVSKMLDASSRADTFLESKGRGHFEEALAKMASVVSEKEDDEKIPETVGPYRLIRKIGRGGMGQVYLAVRDDEAFKRYVAVKVIRRGMDTDDILTRFRVERQILASLTHTGIARLLDGGATDDGVSYFVMEYVDGEPITKYCDENRLSLKKRLDLFSKVCAAVHFAHQNLIVHRDLKPDNILVTTAGEVKLLDFGIAKFLNPDLAGYTLPMTRAEVRVMTPEYASPEQVRGNSVTTASDVYQLGILLYELLTGHRPFTFETVKRGEIENIILEKAPEKPSTMISRVEELPEGKRSLTPEYVSGNRRTPLDRLRKQLSGDLDHIVLMALRKETDRRYQSADQLLQDIQNYRTGRPVSAQADTFSYRASKFVQRNKLAVTGVLAMAVILIGATFVSIGFAVEAAEQRDLFEIEARKSAGVVEFLVTLFEEANPENLRGRQLTVRELVDEGAKAIPTSLVDHPEVQSEMMRVLSMVYSNWGEREIGMALIEPALRIQKTLWGDTDSPSLAAAMYTMAVLLDDSGKSKSSIQMHREALAMRRRLFGENHLDVAQSLNDLGVSLYGAGDYDSVRVVWEQSLALRQEIHGKSHRDIAESLSNLGAVFGDQYFLSGFEDESLFRSAEDYFLRALAMTRETTGENHPFYASNLHNFGSVLLDKGALDEAALKFVEAIEKRTLIYGRDHDNTARSVNYLGRVRNAQGRFGEAESHFRESLEIHERILGPGHPVVGRDYDVLGRFFLGMGDMEQGVSSLLRSLSIYQSLPDVDTDRILSLVRRLGSSFETAGRSAEAERYFLLALASITEEDGITSPAQADDLINAARILITNGKARPAGAHLDRARAYLTSAEGDHSKALGEISSLREPAN